MVLGAHRLLGLARGDQRLQGRNDGVRNGLSGLLHHCLHGSGTRASAGQQCNHKYEAQGDPAQTHRAECGAGSECTLWPTGQTGGIRLAPQAKALGLDSVLKHKRRHTDWRRTPSRFVLTIHRYCIMVRWTLSKFPLASDQYFTISRLARRSKLGDILFVAQPFSQACTTKT